MVIENDEVEVDLDDDAGLDEDPLAGDVDSSWRGKKRRRAETLIKESEAEAKRLREELAAERAASRDLTARVGKLEGVASALVDEDIDDPFESELTDLHDERKSIQKQWYGLSAKARDEQQEAFEARMAENEAKRTDVAVRRPAPAPASRAPIKDRYFKGSTATSSGTATPQRTPTATGDRPSRRAATRGP